MARTDLCAHLCSFKHFQYRSNEDVPLIVSTAVIRDLLRAVDVHLDQAPPLYGESHRRKGDREITSEIGLFVVSEPRRGWMCHESNLQINAKRAVDEGKRAV